ncbi:MAG: hypothetical protein HYR62_06225 [Actinobacteria bacterium]|nr:hypothetical protein [Actinomycetota bacterium]MBI3686705.1 hypothetical protein [Actinomycetota bacterium]
MAKALLAAVADRATGWGCCCLYLTSEPEHTATWTSIGFRRGRSSCRRPGRQHRLRDGEIQGTRQGPRRLPTGPAIAPPPSSWVGAG